MVFVLNEVKTGLDQLSRFPPVTVPANGEVNAPQTKDMHHSDMIIQ
jgi:hypothetical protein